MALRNDAHTWRNLARMACGTTAPAVAFIGASVTAQKEGYRLQLIRRLEEYWQRSPLVILNAIGGTGSFFGLANWQHAGLSGKKIDLAVIEYSTGDLNAGLTPLDWIAQVIEEMIVRLKEQSACVCVLHLYRDDYVGEQGDAVRSLYDTVATQHDVPILHIDREFHRLFLRRPDIKKVWFRDSTHTTPEGAQAVAKRTFDFLKAYSWKRRDGATDRCHNSYFSKINIVHGEGWKLVGNEGGQYTYTNTGQVFDFREIEFGRSIKARVFGDVLGVACVVGPRTGSLEIHHQDGTTQKLRLLDAHCYYDRVTARPIKKLSLSGDQIELRVSDWNVDFSVVKHPHQDFLAPRVIKLVGLIGVNLKLYWE